MKRSERHHLKENELALSVARARDTFEEHKNRIVAAAALIVVVIAAVSAYTWWRHRVDTQSRAMLVEAMAVAEAQVVPPPAPPAEGQPATAANTPPPPGSFQSEQAKLSAALPKFMAVADAYPSSRSGVAARYHAAACLTGLGRHKEAIDRFKEVVDRDGDGLYGDMARLGVAQAQLQAGQYDAAIASFRELTTKTNLPSDAVLLDLGRAYAKAGRKAEAKQAFQRVVDEFPQSEYAQQARRELDGVKG